MRRRWSPRTITMVGLWAGLLAGLAELSIQGGRQHVLGQFLTLGRHYVWMLPLTSAAIGLVVALAIVLPSVVFDRLRDPIVPLIPLGWLASYGILQFVPGLAPWAIGLLALGTGIQWARVFVRHEDRFLSFVRRSLAVMVAVAVLVGAGFPAWWRFQEWRARSALVSPPPGAPNVLLLVLDTVRAWELSTYGYPRATTPNLDRRARDGIVFERAYSESPWTLPSHAAMFTGRRPTKLSANWFTPLDDSTRTLAEAMTASGFLTAGFVANQRYASRQTGLHRGFIEYSAHPPSLAEAIRSVGLLRKYFGSFETRFGERDSRSRRRAAAINRQFLAWVDRAPGQPFFAFLNYFDAHRPYLPPPIWWERFRTVDREQKLYGPDIALSRFRGRPLPPDMVRQLRDLYDASIASLDEQIEALLAALENRGILERTVVIITADHGAQFGEHGMLDHGNSLYPAALQVPLIVLDPTLEAGVRIGSPVSLRSLAPTIAEVAGVRRDRFPARSIAGCWRPAPAATCPPTEPILVSVDYDRRLWWNGTPLNRGDMRGVIVDSMLLIRNGDGVEEAYHVSQQDGPNLLAEPAYRPAMLSLRTRLEGLLRPDSTLSASSEPEPDQ